jgi:cell division protein FtsQ
MRRATPTPLPVDVRLMNVTASLLYVACAVLVAVALAWWAVRHPLFALARITVQGEVSHNSGATLRANVAPRVAGNFFTVNLAAARRAFEDVPWVRRAVVHREFPNRLRVTLEEHKAVALWGQDGDTTLVNSFGEVFEANPDDVDADLPRLAGPKDQSAQVLELWRALASMFEPLDLAVRQLVLTSRGSWQAELDTGARIELGRGTPQDVVPRAQRFVHTLTQAASHYGRRPEALVAADLRHVDAYAIRLRGVSTLGADAQQKK